MSARSNLVLSKRFAWQDSKPFLGGLLRVGVDLPPAAQWHPQLISNHQGARLLRNGPRAKASSSIHLRSESDWPARMSLPKFSWMLHHSAFPGALSQVVFGPFDC